MQNVLSEAAQDLFDVATKFDLSRLEFTALALMILAYYPNDTPSPTKAEIAKRSKALASNSQKLEDMFRLLGNPIDCAAISALILRLNLETHCRQSDSRLNSKGWNDGKGF